MLRSPDWIAETGCEIGASIGLSIPEMGLGGWARVIDVKPCPKLQTGAGRVVTMTITHFNAFVLRFKIEGLSEILEPTILHPLYSEDRGQWVHAGELKVGERLRTKTGPARIEAISHKEGTYRVYNFEVEETHAYYTSNSRVLSHNSTEVNCVPGGAIPGKQKVLALGGEGEFPGAINVNNLFNPGVRAVDIAARGPLVVGDMAQLPFRTSSVDAVVGRSMPFQHGDWATNVVSESFRVLKSGGTAAMHHKTLGPTVWREYMQAAGFKNVRIEKHAGYGYCVGTK